MKQRALLYLKFNLLNAKVDYKEQKLNGKITISGSKNAAVFSSLYVKQQCKD